MKDWKGNKIKHGDTIVIAATNRLMTEYTVNRKLTTHKNDDYFMVKGGEYLVIQENGTFFYTMGNFRFLLPHILFGLQQGDIICIKGVSDKKEDYYQTPSRDKSLSHEQKKAPN